MSKDNKDIQVIPFYFVADVSYSMGEPAERPPIDELNKLLPVVHEAVISNPMVGDLIRFGMISFSDTAVVELPLSDLSELPKGGLPTLTLRGGTSFSVALRKLKEEILKDFQRLKGDGFKVKRPVALLLSDGEPTEEESLWRKAFEELTSIPEFPNLVPIGIGGCNREIIRELRHRKDGKAPAPALFPADGENVGEKIKGLIEALTKSIVQSAKSAASGASQEGGHAKAVFDELAATPGWDPVLDD